MIVIFGYFAILSIHNVMVIKEDVDRLDEKARLSQEEFKEAEQNLDKAIESITGNR